MDCAISRHWPWPQQRRRSDWPRSPRRTDGAVHHHRQLDRVPAARPGQYHQLAAGGFRPAAPISPISVVPHTLWTLSMR